MMLQLLYFACVCVTVYVCVCACMCVPVTTPEGFSGVDVCAHLVYK